MKLLFCDKCNDVFSLVEKSKWCSCEGCGGQYLDNLNAVYWGDTATPIGFSNSSFVKAVINRPKEGMGSKFEAFVIPIRCSTMKKITPPNKEQV